MIFGMGVSNTNIHGRVC